MKETDDNLNYENESFDNNMDFMSDFSDKSEYTP